MKELDDRINLGKVTENDFKESDSVTVLRKIVEKNRRIKVRNLEAEKIPNLDGKLMILDDNMVERNTIEIQIKTLPHGYDKSKPYKYSCDTKAFNVVLYHITLNPVVLIMVDTVNEKVYWKNITKQYAQSLKIDFQKNKTVYFTDKDLFDENKFIKEMNSSYEQLFEKLDSNNINKSTIITNVAEKSDDYIELQTQVDRLNNMFENELLEVKKRFFKDVWKFGIAYDKYENGSAIGIYLIMIGENNTLIKKFDINQGYQYMSMSFRITVDVKEYVDDWIKNVIKKYYLKVPINVSFLSDDILNEIVYYFLDNLSITIKDFESKNSSHLYYKDEEDINSIINSIYGLEYFFEDIISTRDKENESNLASLLMTSYNQIGKFLIFNPLLQLTDNEREILREYIHRDNAKTQLKFYSSSSCNIELSIEAIEELQRRGMTKVRRIWNKKDWEKCKIDFSNTKYLRSGYSKIDLIGNINRFFDILEENYKETLEKMQLTEKSPLHDLHTIVLNEKDFTLYTDYIKNDLDFKIKKIIISSSEEEFEPEFDFYICSKLESLFLLNTPLYDTVRTLIYIGILKNKGFIFEDSKLSENIDIGEIPIINYYVE